MIKSICFLTVVLCAWSSHCESIDYRKAAEIFRDLQLGSNPTHDSDASGLHIAPPVPLTRFINFMKDYDRVYTSRSDLFERHGNFISNVETAENYQSLDEGTAKYSITKFSDWSDRYNLTGFRLKSEGIQYPELPEHLLGGSSEDDDYSKSHVNPVLNWLSHWSKLMLGRVDRAPGEADALPGSVDWRERGAISKVKMQGDCQSCYAFSVIGIVEGMHAIQTGNMVNLSVQQIVDCDTSNKGCHGGRMDNALQYLMNVGGVVTEKEYPYVGREHKHCLTSQVDAPSKVKVKSYERLPNGREDLMKKWMAQNGPLSVGINGDSLYYYTDGIMDLGDYSCDPERQNHAVIAVGYGKEKRSDGSSIPYWILKNSWGEDWGEGGYFRLRMGVNSCGVGVFVHGAKTK